MKQYKFTVTKIKPSELDNLNSVVCHALAVPKNEYKRVIEWLKWHGTSNLRAIRHKGEIIGGLQIIYWGHWFGGRSVPATGISFVGIKPEFRRIGAASLLLNEMLRETYDEGVPISSLYPANVPLYRKTGYERAIDHAHISINLKEINIRNMSLDMVRYKGKSTKTLEKAYRKFASGNNGILDRTPPAWKIILKPWDPPLPDVYFIKRGRTIEGYVVMHQKKEHGPLRIIDYVTPTRDAAERLLTFLSDHSSIIKEVKYSGSISDPLIHLVPHKSYEIKNLSYCMLRVVSVAKALSARGYMKGIDAELHFDVKDDILKKNNGCFILKVKDGRGKVKKGGEGKIKIDIRSLAQLYTGFLSPHELEIAGDINAPEESLNLATAVFSGPRPWIRDDF